MLNTPCFAMYHLTQSSMAFEEQRVLLLSHVSHKPKCHVKKIIPPPWALFRPGAISSLILFVLVLGCTDESLLEERSVKSVPSATVKDKLSQHFAKSLAASLSDQNVRDFIKDRTLNRFDGDNNFLFQFEKDREIGRSASSAGKATGKTLAEVLFPAARADSRVGTAPGLLDSLGTLHPLLQVAIPSLAKDSIENWDTATRIPLVAYVPEKEGDELIAFDAEGNEHRLSATEEPDQLVIVISENERVMATAKSGKSASGGRAQMFDDVVCMTLTPIYSTDEYNYYYRSDYYTAVNSCYSGGGSSGGGFNSGPVPCDRDTRNNKDELVRMKFSSIRDFNFASQWFDGGLEIEVTVTFARPNGAVAKVTKFISWPDRDFKNCPFPGFTCKPAWKNVNLEIITWDKETYGDAMHYFWVEKDPGTQSTLSTSFSTTFDNTDGSKSTLTNTLSFTITTEDDLLGEAVVEYCDKANNEGYQYSTGKIYFNVKER